MSAMRFKRLKFGVISSMHATWKHQVHRRGVARQDVIVILIVCAILSMVFARAVSEARITARKIACLGKMQQIMLAVNAYCSLSQNRTFPGLSAELEIVNAEGQAGTLNVPWTIQVLPMIDAAAVLRDIQKNAVRNSGNSTSGTMRISDAGKVWLDVFACVDDPDSFRQPGGLSYVINAGFIPRELYHGDPDGRHGVGLLSWDGNTNPDEEHDLRVSAATGVVWRAHKSFRSTSDDVGAGDGISSTLLLSENLQAGPWYEIDTAKIAFGLPVEAIDSQIPFGEGACFESAAQPLNTDFTGGTLTTATPQDWRMNTDLQARPGTRPRPSSNHKGGVNAVFCDGSGRFLSDSIDPQVYVKLLTSNGINYGESPLRSDY